jgi:preprotein translocase subunit SecA
MHFDIRKQLLAYDNVMNQQREAVYTERRTILEEENIVDYGWGIIQGVVEEMLDRYFPEGGDNEPDPDRAASRMRSVFGPGRGEEMVARLDSRIGMELVREEIVESVKARCDQRISELTPEVADGLVRYIVLNTLDSAWRDHLLGMDELRRGIGLRAIGQKDPLLEYQFESYNLFQEMMLRVRESFVEQFFRVRVVSEDIRRERRLSEGRDFPMPVAFGPDRMPQARQEGESKPEPVRKGVKIGRNDPCPCGSGKKYKHCCGKNA